MPPKLLLWLLASLLILPGCAPEKTLGDDVNRLKFVEPPAPEKDRYEFGEGLDGRIVDGKRVYTVQVRMVISKEGKVVHAEVQRSDAPERLQWATVRAVRNYRFPPARKQMIASKAFIYRGLDVKPG